MTTSTVARACACRGPERAPSGRSRSRERTSCGAAVVSPPTTGTPVSAMPSYSSSTSSTSVSAGAPSVTTRHSGVGARRGEVAEVDRGGAKAEIAPGDPVEPEVDALDERVLRDDEPAAELRGVVLDPAARARAARARPAGRTRRARRASRSSRPSTSTGPSPAPIPARPRRTASDATSAACRAAASRSSPAGEQRRERRRVRAAGPVRRRRPRGAATGICTSCSPSKNVSTGSSP